MTGGIMPKVSAVRWAIALSVMLLLAAGTIGFATSLSGRPANDSAPGEDYAGERRGGGLPQRDRAHKQRRHSRK